MDRKQTTAAAFWCQVFLDRFPDCIKSLDQRGPQGCAQLSAEQADAALAEFNKRFGGIPAVVESLRKLRARLLVDPEPGHSAGRVVSHYAGLVSTAVLEVEAAIQQLTH